MALNRLQATAAFVLLVSQVVSPSSSRGQAGAASGEWHHYAGDGGSTNYSALDQIDRNNFAQLEVAWRWRSADERLPEGASPIEPGHFLGRPLMIDGVIYIPTGLSQVVALDARYGRGAVGLRSQELRARNPGS